MQIILRIYDYLTAHKGLRRWVLASITLLALVSVCGLSYKEDITDFLPASTHEREMLEVYRNVSGADRFIVVFSDKGGADSIAGAVATFVETVKGEPWAGNMTAEVDMERVAELTGFVYDNMPYFLTSEDYAHIDSILSVPGLVAERLEEDRNMLLLPSGSMMAENIGRDPLGLFTPVISRLGELRQGHGFEIYNGYVFTPDMSRAIVTIPSPYGNAETKRNAQLQECIEKAAEKVRASHKGAEIHVTGGPAIAVSNAAQIKQDSILAVAISAVLILSLLAWSFRSVKSILLMALSIGWGWLFALGLMHFLSDSVSIIVIGISSVIIGIAVNYPLHLMAHLTHEPSVRQTLKDISKPLLVGNITTVGAFMALIPMQATALSDLGLFASLLLIGTIAFVLVFMPHMAGKGRQEVSSGGEYKTGDGLLACVTTVRLERKKWLMAVVAVLTVVFGWFSLKTEFDTDMSHINYMTPEQRADMDYFARLAQCDTMQTREITYVVSRGETLDAVLDSVQATGLDKMGHFLTSEKEQARRLRMWQEFKSRHEAMLMQELPGQAVRCGFSADAFTSFTDMMRREYKPQTFGYFMPLMNTVFSGNLKCLKGTHTFTVVEQVTDRQPLHGETFTARSINGTMAAALSSNFNYIGIVCSFIVFLFLWMSFRSLKVAVIAFVPMALGWVWILGIMAMLGIKFNIVNIILATFIFGQGDDYTIFITEGCLREKHEGTDILPAYKRSILLSAAIMFIGIGTLIFAKHPALFSLAEVTIVGMACVVFMAWVVPPFLINRPSPKDPPPKTHPNPPCEGGSTKRPNN